MLTVLGYHAGDRDQAERLANWIAELGGCKGHSLLLLRDKGAAPIPEFTPSFDKVDEIVVIDDIWHSWPQSPNNVFQTAARHIAELMPQPWLWIEPDVAPMQPRWIDALAKEYSEAGKPFLGDYVKIIAPGDQNGDHMSGVGIYPGKLYLYAGPALVCVDLAWDMAARRNILGKMHDTKLIQHAWNHPKFESIEEARKEIAPETVLYHASKDGSLIDLLRKEREKDLSGGAEKHTRTVFAGRPAGSIPAPRDGGAQTLPTPAAQNGGSGSSAPPAQILCDIFIKSYPPDFPWLDYCLRSIEKFASGFRELVIVAPDGNCPVPSSFPHRLVVTTEFEESYLSQQLYKLNAHQFTDADYVLHMDSDCIFTRPITPQTYFANGKPEWLLTSLENAREDQIRTWVPVMRAWMGKHPGFEFMRRHPFLFPRWLYEEIHRFCKEKHGLTLDRYILGSQGFSEFNCGGFYAHEFHRDKFTWIDSESPDVPAPTVLQKWSYGGLTEEVKAEFEIILGGEENGLLVKGMKGGNARTADEESLVQNSASSVQSIRQTAGGHWESPTEVLKRLSIA